MFLDITPEHLPIISAQLSSSTADLRQVIGTQAPDCIPMPQAQDDISRLLIPPVFAPWYAGFSGPIGEGIGHRISGAAEIPAATEAYFGEGILNGAHVSAMSVAFVE